MLVYHGSDHIIEAPIFNGSKRTNDYGYGFYTTESSDLAKEWACADNRDGFANVYQVELDGLQILNLNSPEYNILNWLAILGRKAASPKRLKTICRNTSSSTHRNMMSSSDTAQTIHTLLLPKTLLPAPSLFQSSQKRCSSTNWANRSYSKAVKHSRISDSLMLNLLMLQFSTRRKSSGTGMPVVPIVILNAVLMGSMNCSCWIS